MSNFADKLRTEMESRGIRVLTLAKLVDPANAEQERNSLRKYLNGKHVPRPARRWRIEDALGLERDSLAPDDDEEDSLDKVLGRAVRQAVSSNPELRSLLMDVAA